MARSRRSVLASLAAAAGLSGCSGVVERLPDDGSALEEQVRTAAEAASNQVDGKEPPTEPFDDATRERASETGQTVRDSVVVLETDRRRGTGWAVGDGQIVTNAHVVMGAPSMSVETFDETTGTAERIGYYDDMRPDLALLETDVSVPTLSLGDSSDLEYGDPLITVGHPGRLGKWLITLGRFYQRPRGIDWLLSTVPVQQGNSGGPLLTLDGDVVGVVSGSTTGGDQPDFSKNETAFTELPETEGQTTAVPEGTLEESLSEWR
ncbi:S1C family serine protease [Haloarcula amylovorans]|uniref:S1C family serine protease n=1 Tax=Haloarcula amylovorans TaxID=2562280 RepID=UPI0010761C02|nr:serine protease [Halomicroarcula amylolytica]